MALQKAASMKVRARARYFRRRLFARMVEASHFGSSNVRASFEMESWHLSTRTRHFFSDCQWLYYLQIPMQTIWQLWKKANRFTQYQIMN